MINLIKFGLFAFSCIATVFFVFAVGKSFLQFWEDKTAYNFVVLGLCFIIMLGLRKITIYIIKEIFKK